MVLMNTFAGQEQRGTDVENGPVHTVGKERIDELRK